MVADVLALHDPADDTQVSHLILHGHQFDSTTHPDVAARFGETFSETAGLWFHGADRRWRWAVDLPREWVNGLHGFPNQLVNDGRNDPFGTRALEPDDAAATAEYTELMAEIEEQLAREVRRGRVELEGAERGLDTRGSMFWQTILERFAFHHAVGWEHFRNAGLVRVLTRDVRRDGRFFKFRHTDEQLVRREMLEAFAGEPPVVVLGHTHEPRHTAHDPTGAPYAQYLNSGAAGRFERLLWAIEIRDGKGQVVSWSQPTPGGPIQRNTWRSEPWDDEVFRERRWSLLANPASDLADA